jgi:hypothetical protein
MLAEIQAAPAEVLYVHTANGRALDDLRALDHVPEALRGALTAGGA